VNGGDHVALAARCRLGLDLIHGRQAYLGDRKRQAPVVWCILYIDV
jgi:hypothetical protein